MKHLLPLAGDLMAPAKPALRRVMRQIRDAIPGDRASVAELRAGTRLSNLDELARAQTIALYASFGSELGTRQIAELLWKQGKSVVFPRVMPEHRSLNFCPVASFLELVPSSRGIPEPAATVPAVDIRAIDAFVIPGLAFDRAGNRLGWGAGHYDHTLAQNPDAIRIGYGYDSQLIDNVPCDDHDIVMNVIVTETQTWNPYTSSSR